MTHARQNDNDKETAENAPWEDTRTGIIAWFARNPVAANLLMMILIIGGLLTAMTIRKQMFPQIEIDWISIGVVYPGAAPQEVEEGITIRVEEVLETVRGLDRVITYSNRGGFQAYVRINRDYDPQEVLNEVKSQIDAVPSFPDGMERPIVERIKYEQEVMYISLYGDLSYRQLKELGRELHDEIQTLPLVNIATFHSGLDYEISIEVSRDKLREYGLSFSDIAAAVRNFSTNMSAGQIRAQAGHISVRVENQAYTGREFETLPLINLEDGTQVLLGQVARVNDGFEEGIQYSKFNGKNSVGFEIGASRDQSITDVAKVVKDYIERKQAQLPPGVKLETWVDLTYYLEGRLDMMLDNMKSGGLLVFLMLALFLRIRLAFWVMMGLPVCFLGTLLVMPMEWFDVSINLASLFGFILVLGIVVDDAIVIGESIHSEIEEQGHSLDNVIRGAKRVAMPATFGVLTTVAAFAPMMLADSPESVIARSIGLVVIFCLLFSLVESKLILPAHLAKMKMDAPNPANPLHRLRNSIDGGLKRFVEGCYRPALTRAIHYRYTVVMFFISIFLVSAGMFMGGVMRFVGSPKIPHDFPRVNLTMNATSSEQATLDAALKIERALYRVDETLKEKYGTGMIGDMSVMVRSRTEAEIMVKLVDPELRPLGTFELSALWREAIPPLPGMKSFTIEDNIFGSERDDGDISFRLEGRNEEQLQRAAAELKRKLESIKGVGDVNDSRQSEAREVQFTLKPLAYSMGLTIADVASQLSFSFYGLEAQRLLRNGEEIKVMVRYPEEQRNAVGHVEDVLIRTPAGAEVPLIEVADLRVVDSVNSVRRENGKRSINVWASVNAAEVEPLKVTRDILDNFLPEMLKSYPGVTSEVAGRIQEEMESNQTQLRDFVISLMVIYALLAVPLRSYAQPLMIMSVIPFGIIGAMLGHLILGMDMSSLSMFGIIAASGVVVNDSLVMVDFVNTARARGMSSGEAVVEAGCRRFRAIMLTSVTTFIGLVPIIMETSLQAKIVIPMAVSLAFGVLFATVITLLLIPCLYVVGGDIAALFKRRKKEPEKLEAEAVLD